MVRVIVITNHHNTTAEQREVVAELRNRAHVVTEAFWSDLLYHFDGENSHTISFQRDGKLLALRDYDVMYVRADVPVDQDARHVIIREAQRLGLRTVGTIPHVGIGRLEGKADTMHIIQKEYGLRFPKTFFGHGRVIEEQFDHVKNTLGTPFVCKPNLLSKGRGVALVHNLTEYRAYINEIAEKYGERKLYLLAQEYIPNDGDYRALYLGGEWFVIKRQSQSEDEFRNNVSLGGKATKASLPKEILSVCENIAKDMTNDFLGFDFIEHNGALYCLEINRCPGIGGASAAYDKNLYQEQAAYIAKNNFTSQKRLFFGVFLFLEKAC